MRCCGIVASFGQFGIAATAGYIGSSNVKDDQNWRGVQL